MVKKEKLDEILEEHEKWLSENGGERPADLRDANLRRADLRRADLWRADLRYADLRGANLRGTNLWGADLRRTDFSQSAGLVSQADWLEENLEKKEEGYIAYKSFGRNYDPPDDWSVEKGVILTENVNPCRTIDCACGVNVATRGWEEFGNEAIWKVLIRWKWLPGVVVPYNTDGKFRTEKVELVEKT